MTQPPLPVSKIPMVPPRILLGPGPSMVHPRVLQAMMQPMIGYLDPDFVLIMDEVVTGFRLSPGGAQGRSGSISPRWK